MNVGLSMLRERFPGININANPPPRATQPRLTMVPNDRRIQEAGWARRNVASMIAMLGDGQFIGEYFDGDSRMNMILRTEGWETPDELAGLPIATPTGAVVPLGDLVSAREEVGVGGIQRLNRRRTVTININQPDDLTRACKISHDVTSDHTGWFLDAPDLQKVVSAIMIYSISPIYRGIFSPSIWGST